VVKVNVPVVPDNLLCVYNPPSRGWVLKIRVQPLYNILIMSNNLAVSVEEWLANLSPELRTIARELVSVARKNMPKAHEFIYHDAVGYSVSDSPFDRICYIAPQKKGYINFGFFFGANLPDPKHLLIGEGKRLRHIKVRSVEEAKNPAFGKLISATWKEAPDSIEKIHAQRKKVK